MGELYAFFEGLSGGDQGGAGDDAAGVRLDNARVNGGAEAEIIGVDEKFLHLNARGWRSLGREERLRR